MLSTLSLRHYWTCTLAVRCFLPPAKIFKLTNKNYLKKVLYTDCCNVLTPPKNLCDQKLVKKLYCKLAFIPPLPTITGKCMWISDKPQSEDRKPYPANKTSQESEMQQSPQSTAEDEGESFFSMLKNMFGKSKKHKPSSEDQFSATACTLL